MNGDLSPEETELLNNSSNGHLATAVYNADTAEEEQESLSPDSTTSPELNLRIRFVRICLDFQGFYFRKSIERSKLLFVFATLCSNFWNSSLTNFSSSPTMILMSPDSTTNDEEEKKGEEEEGKDSEGGCEMKEAGPQPLEPSENKE